MKHNRDELIKIKNTLDYLVTKEWFSDYSEELHIDLEDIDELAGTEFEMPEFIFPGEDNTFEISSDDFLQIADEITSLNTADSAILKTNLRRYYIVEAADSAQHFLFKNMGNFKSNKGTEIRLDLVSSSFIIGIAATELGEYDSDFWGTASQYLAVEIIYDSNSDILSENIELDLVQAYIFEIADSTGSALNFGKIINKSMEYEIMVENAAEEKIGQLRELEKFNDGMRLFVSAIQIKESELKFLNFYKILEHFAPIAVNIEANEIMRKKLDSPKASFEDGDFIRSIFDLAKSMRDKFNDEELIKATFNTCFDFVGIFEKLPEMVQKKVKKQIGDSTINYSTSKEKISNASNMVGKIIYATRNRVVHAKSNFISLGNECDTSDIPQLNNFMKEATSQTIRWYNRQPNHVKLNIIN